MKPRATFSPRIAVRILNGLANGQGLRAICRDPAMPSRSTVHTWSRRHPATADTLTLARDIAEWPAAERQWEAWQAKAAGWVNCV